MILICALAREAIKKKIKNEAADVYFVSGWTQANAIVIASVLESFESVIAATTWHINVHEAWAIEATGHRIEPISSQNGKITPDDVDAVLARFEDHHMTRPKMVYISQATERELNLEKLHKIISSYNFSGQLPLRKEIAALFTQQYWLLARNAKIDKIQEAILAFIEMYETKQW